MRYDVEVAYTRAEWIAFLSNLFGLEPFMPEQVDEELIDPAPLYTDIAGIPQEGLINAAVFNGILTDQGGAFRPNDPATRDFAAATAIRALGFGQEQKIVCEDSAEVSSPYEAYIAVDIGLMSLLNNRFCPDSVLSRQEAEQIKATVEEINGSVQRTGSGGKGIILQDGVISLDEGTPFTDDGTTLTLSASIPALSGLKEGDVVVIGLQKAFKVTGIRKRGKNLEITYTEPKIQEFIDEIDTYGTGYLDFEHFQPAPGVSVIKNGRDEPMPMALDSVELPVQDVVLDLPVPLKNDFELTFSIGFSNSTVRFGDKAVVNKETGELETRNRYLILDTTTFTSASISSEFVSEDDIRMYITKDFEGKYPVGFVPIGGLAPGTSITLEVYAVFSVDGSISITYSVPTELGVQMISDHVRYIKDFKKPETKLALSASTSVSGRLSLVLREVGISLLSCSAEAGIRASLTSNDDGKWREEEHVWCADLTAEAYFELSVMKDTIFEDYLKLFEDYVDIDLQFADVRVPIGTGHFENLKLVKECTYARGYIVGTVSELRTSTPVAGAQIDVISKEDFSVVASAMSDSLGQYRVKVKPGTYIVQASKEGYDASRRDSVSVEEDEETELNLQIYRKATPTPSPTPTPKPTPTPTAVPIPPSGTTILLKNILLTLTEFDYSAERSRPLSGINVKLYQKHSNGSFRYVGGGMTDFNGQLMLDVNVMEDYFIDGTGSSRWDEIKFTFTIDQRYPSWDELPSNSYEIGSDFGFTLEYYNRIFKATEEEEGIGYCEVGYNFTTGPEYWD